MRSMVEGFNGTENRIFERFIVIAESPRQLRWPSPLFPLLPVAKAAKRVAHLRDWGGGASRALPFAKSHMAPESLPLEGKGDRAAVDEVL